MIITATANQRRQTHLNELNYTIRDCGLAQTPQIFNDVTCLEKRAYLCGFYRSLSKQIKITEKSLDCAKEEHLTVKCNFLNHLKTHRDSSIKGIRGQPEIQQKLICNNR